MGLVADDLKRKRAEIGAQIRELRVQITALEQQQTAFDLVIRTYEPGYVATPPNGTPQRQRRLDPNGISDLFKDFDRRSFVLRTLREAGQPTTTAEIARTFARERGLNEDDARLGLIGNRFSQVLDQLSKAKRVQRAGMADGHRVLWSVAL